MTSHEQDETITFNDDHRTLRTWKYQGSRPAATTAIEMECLLQQLPKELSDYLRKCFADRLEEMNELYLQLGMRPKLILLDSLTDTKQGIFLGEVKCKPEHLDLFADFFLRDSKGVLNSKRKGIPSTLHRLSVVTKPSPIATQDDKVIGVAVRVGRSFEGLLEEMTGNSFIFELARARRSLLLIGKPGVGKTTVLREIARILSQESDLEVVVVDKTCEIAGDGLEPHPCIGNSRWMPVGVVGKQHDIMLEAVENQSPDVIIVDEISTPQEVYAARTIASRGVMLIATVHGVTLPEVILCKERGILTGGVASVTLSGQEANRRFDKRKQVQKRAQEPIFSTAIELHSRGKWVYHHSVKDAADAYFEAEPFNAQEFRPGRSISIAAIPGEGIVEYCYKCGQGPTCIDHAGGHGNVSDSSVIGNPFGGGQARNQNASAMRQGPFSLNEALNSGTSSQNHGRKTRRNRQRAQRGSGFCRNCGKNGHYARDCMN